MVLSKILQDKIEYILKLGLQDLFRASKDALKVISSLLLLEKDPSEVLLNYTKIPQINNAVKVSNKDIVNDKDLLNLIKEIESDITVGRVLVRPSGTESKIRVMIEAPEEKVAKKYVKDICDLIKSKT